MAGLQTLSKSQLTSETQEDQDSNNAISPLPQHRGWGIAVLRKYQEFWLPELTMPAIIDIQNTFEARPSDLILVTSPKSGTTWLKALVFSIVNRGIHPFDRHPLLTSTPHDCVPFLPIAYMIPSLRHKLDNLPTPRILALHLAHSSLPASVARSDCRIVYLCRDPKDTLVSMWHFVKDLHPEGVEPPSFNEAYELFCSGVSLYGPFWDHSLEYWRESLRRPDKVLFLKYEEMMDDPMTNLKRMAEFMGCRFSDDEERRGVVGEIIRLCSFEKLSGLEANKMEADIKNPLPMSVTASSFFRTGKVGDWRNHLSPEMAQRLDCIVEEKLRGSGLSFHSSYD